MAIILVLAAVVAWAPGGGSGANVVIEAISLGFLAAVGWIGAVMYRQHRSALYALGDGRRAALYGAAVVLALTSYRHGRSTSTSGGSGGPVAAAGGGQRVRGRHDHLVGAQVTDHAGPADLPYWSGGALNPPA